MFTGIITSTGRVLLTKPVLAKNGAVSSLKLRILTGFKDLTLGESVSVDGACLTVTEFTPEGEADFFVSPETLARTTLGELGADARVNLERAVSLQTRLSGHLVQGHIDGKARLISVTPEGESFSLSFELPSALTRSSVEKGSIAINGVSLTINAIETGKDHSFVRVTIIPHTWSATNLSTLKPGQQVNVEIDILAKYVEQLCRPLFQTP